MKTNYFYYVEDFVGSSVLKESVLKIYNYIVNIDSRYYKRYFITNPILKTLLKSSIIQGANVDFDMKNLSTDYNWLFFKFVSNLIAFTREEVEKNQDFKDDLVKDLLSNNRGQFYSILNELLIGGFLKFIDYKIKFNSSKQRNRPDVVVKEPLQFANEGKLYPDFEFELFNKISLMIKEILFFLSKLKDVEIIAFVSGMDNFRKEFVELGNKHLETNKPQMGNSLTLMKNTFYIGKEGYVVDYLKTNSKIRFKPNFNAAMSIDKLKEILCKSEKQFSNENLPGITWITFPNPKESSIERRLIWEVTQIPSDFKERNLALILYELFFKPNPNGSVSYVETALDIVTNSEDIGFINFKNFNKFISEIIDKPVLLIP